jgi:hypothetical protein
MYFSPFIDLSGFSGENYVALHSSIVLVLEYLSRHGKTTGQQLSKELKRLRRIIIPADISSVVGSLERFGRPFQYNHNHLVYRVR